MSNPQLNFRLNQQQIANSLAYILSIEPYQPPLSASLLVKTLYLDLLAKASFNKTIPISPAIYASAEAMIASKVTPEERANLWKIAANQNIQNIQTELAIQPTQPLTIQSTNVAADIPSHSYNVGELTFTQKIMILTGL